MTWQQDSVCGILQARILEWVAIPFSRGSCQLRNQTRVSCIAADSLPSEPPGSPGAKVKFIFLHHFVRFIFLFIYFLQYLQTNDLCSYGFLWKVSLRQGSFWMAPQEGMGVLRRHFLPNADQGESADQCGIPVTIGCFLLFVNFLGTSKPLYNVQHLARAFIWE